MKKIVFILVALVALQLTQANSFQKELRADTGFCSAEDVVRETSIDF